jgi:L-ascorbate peroxidase
MKARLRDEYVGLGGTPSKPMPANLFLNIILFISTLAILCKVGGILP